MDSVGIIANRIKTAPSFRVVPDEAIAFTQSGEPFAAGRRK
ncbi:hypothetical protein [Nostoc sp.]